MTNRVFFIVISLMLVIYSWYMVACIISCLPQPSPQCWWLQLWWKGHTPSSWSPPTPLSNAALSAPHILPVFTSSHQLIWSNGFVFRCFAVFMCYTSNVYFPYVGLPLKKVYCMICSSSILCLSSLCTTIHDAGVYTHNRIHAVSAWTMCETCIDTSFVSIL